MENQDYEYQEILMSLGESRTTALVLTYMRNHNTVKSSELEKEMGLRQPEVSIAMRELKERGWIVCNTTKVSGKGRPSILYILSVGLDTIIYWYQAQAEVKEAHQRQMIQKLKETIR